MDGYNADQRALDALVDIRNVKVDQTKPPEERIRSYVEQVKDFPFWCACLKSVQYIGFFSAKIHYGHTAVLHFETI